MKKICALALSLAIFFAACNNKNAEKKSQKEKKVSKRNYSITKQNAYNNIFLDSMAVENFILKNNIADSLARRIRSFYNTRNYQFAWFSSDGLTEQAYGFWSLQNYYSDTSNKIKGLKNMMDDVMSNDSLQVKPNDKSFIKTELIHNNAKINSLSIDKILEKPIRLEILKHEVQKLVSPIPFSK